MAWDKNSSQKNVLDILMYSLKYNEIKNYLIIFKKMMQYSHRNNDKFQYVGPPETSQYFSIPTGQAVSDLSNYN